MFSVWPCLSLSVWVQMNLWRCNSTPGRFWNTEQRHKGIKSQREPKQNMSAGGEFHLKVLVPRHNFVGEFGQEHGDECGKAPFRSQLVWADPCQPQHVLRDVRGLALEHSTLVQTQTGRGKTTEGRWDGQTHAGEEPTPPR